MVIKDELAKITNSENVLDDPGILEAYSRDESFAHPIRPGCVVKLQNMEEVQALVTWAKETQTPLVPVSSGPPHFRGDTIPGVGGAVIADLSGMKKIIRIDNPNMMAMVEPGVTFGELIPALAEEGLAPFLPLVPRSTKSVVASLLEMEPMMVPRFHWEMSDPMGVVEVIYGTGEMLRTGSANGPGTLEEQWELGKAQISSEGPGTYGFTRLIQGAQGSMGIVTWTSVKCKRLPKVKSAFLIADDRIDRLIELTYKLCWKRLDGECLILNGQNLASILRTDADEIRALREALPPWVLVYTLEAGGIMPEDKIDYQEAELIETAQAYGLEPLRSIPGARAEAVAEALSKPSADPYWKIRAKGGGHDLFFVTTMNRAPEFIARVNELAGACRYPAMDIGIYLQPIMQGANCHLEFDLSYDPEDEEEKEKVKRFISEGSRALSDMGAFFTRPYGPWADVAYGRAPHTMDLQRKLKNFFDPEGIMNPGRLCF